MPSIFAQIKNYVIESEEDIPSKYREEIEKRLSAKEATQPMEVAPIIPGKRGTIIAEESKIESVFQSPQDFYFGHGTPGDETVLSTILGNGLRTVNAEAVRGYSSTLRGLDSTTISFGAGTDTLFQEQKDLLEHWPHKASPNIVIVSLPQKYTLRYADVGAVDLFSPFYVGSEKDGFSLRPEFIKGIYQADSHTFTPNDNFYQNLEPEQQAKLFETIQQQYIGSFAEYSYYAPTETLSPLPFSEAELEEIAIAWYTNQLEKLRNDKTFESQMLNQELQQMASGYRTSEINATTQAMRETVQSKTEEKEITEEEWLLDEWE